MGELTAGERVDVVVGVKRAMAQGMVRGAVGGGGVNSLVGVEAGVNSLGVEFGGRLRKVGGLMPQLTLAGLGHVATVHGRERRAIDGVVE